MTFKLLPSTGLYGRREERNEERRKVIARKREDKLVERFLDRLDMQ